MKKAILLLVLMIALISLISCGGDDTCTEHTDKDGDSLCDRCGATVEAPDNTGDGILLIDNGEFKFQIVQGYDLPVAAKMYIDKLAGMLEDDFGIELRTVTDTEAGAQDCEVLIGTVTSRGDGYKYDRHELGAEGYTIHGEGGKIIISAGNDDLMTATVKKFFEDILGIDADTETIGTVRFLDEGKWHKPQDNYRIKDVTVGGESIRGYKIVVDPSYNGDRYTLPLNSAARELKDFFYTQAGIYLDIVIPAEYNGTDDAIILRGVEKGKAGPSGFRVKVDGRRVYIECAYYNCFEAAFDEYYNKTLAFARAESLAIKNYDADTDFSIVRYANFGAKGDGKTNDYAAIKAAHDFANAGGQTVYADSNAVYYLSEIPEPISIMTNVNWNGAKIIFDDTRVTSRWGCSSAAAVTGVHYDNGCFIIANTVSDFYATEEQLAAVNALKGDGDYTLIGLESRTGKTTDNIGFSLGYPAMLTLYNDNTKNYFRYGYVDTLGSAQHEIILIDAEGNIDPTTPILHDFKDVTRILIHRADTEPLKIQNASFETVTSRINHTVNHYLGRGITISRPNVTVENIEHKLTGEIAKNRPVRLDGEGLAVVAEGYTYSAGKILDKSGKVYTGDDIRPFLGHAYNGFISVSGTHNTLIKNVVFQSHVVYIEGTYDISASNANKIIFDECTQSNFFEEDGKTVNMSKCWGIAGTNYCKNMEYINSALTRYDAHAGVTNGKIIGGSLAVLRLIGGGDFLMEGVTVYAYGNNPLQLRSDYGASFNGTLTIKDCNIVNTGYYPISSLISVPPSYWDMGYKTFMPNIVIDDLKLDRLPASNELLLIADVGTCKYTDSSKYPGFDFLRKDGGDPNTAGYKFHYTTSDPDKWIAENITADGARFHGCTYEVKASGDISTVIVTDTKNQFPYRAPDYIRVLNNEGNGYKLVLYNSIFFKDTVFETDESFERAELPYRPAG